MAHMSNRNETRNRLLEAAAEVFAEQGYWHARIRDICKRAKANIAAVNYHFRDKEQLYLAVVEYALTKAKPGMPHFDLDGDATPAERLRRFIHALVGSIFESGRPAWYGKLLANETIDPTPALNLVVEKLARPITQTLSRILTDLLGPDTDPETMGLCVSSILSQCVIYHNSREIIMRLNPERKFDKAAVERIAQHITNFSFGGLRNLAHAKKKAPALSDKLGRRRN